MSDAGSLLNESLIRAINVQPKRLLLFLSRQSKSLVFRNYAVLWNVAYEVYGIQKSSVAHKQRSCNQSYRFLCDVVLVASLCCRLGLRTLLCLAWGRVCCPLVLRVKFFLMC